MTVKDVAKDFRLDWDTVKTLDKEYMKKQLEVSSSSTSCNWYERNIYKERAYLSDSGKRFGAWKADLVWRKG
ncbi:MAG: transposase family protein [Planctomycetia bacterium]|nr:transposase family protein [Planctomycetia bacterium]